MTDRLHPDDLRDLAELVVQRLAARLAGEEVVPHHARAVDVKTLADELGMSAGWVYAHADELGAERRGDGPRARLRFDLEKARSAFNGESKCLGTETTSRRAAPRPRRTNGGIDLLPVKGATKVGSAHASATQEAR